MTSRHVSSRKILTSALTRERIETGVAALVVMRIATWVVLGWAGVDDGWAGVLALAAFAMLAAVAPFSVGSGYGSATLIGAAAGRRLGGGLGVLPKPTRAVLAVFIGAIFLPVIVVAFTMPGSAKFAESAAWAPVLVAIALLYIRAVLSVARRFRRWVNRRAATRR